MSKTASREVIESFSAFLRRNALLSDREIHARLSEGRLRGPSQAFRSRVGTAPASSDVPAGALVASDAGPDEVRARITQLLEYVAGRVRAGERPALDLPDLHAANAIYDARGRVFLGQNVRRLALDRRGGPMFVRIMLTLETALENLRTGVCTTKRGLFYHHRAKLAAPKADQLESDRALTAAANLLGVRRRSLGFVESKRGITWGRLVLREGETVMDVSQFGRGGWGTPRFMDDVEIVDSDARFILVVEKQCIAIRLNQTRWWDAARCILVCSEGYPSVSTRELVRRLVDTLRIRAIVLADADPAGIGVGLTFAHGSIASALETPWLACDDVWWAGLRPSDVDRYYASHERIRLDEGDHAVARRLLEHPSLAYVHQGIRDELGILTALGMKGELDAMASGPTRFEKEYLAKVLFERELVKL